MDRRTYFKHMALATGGIFIAPHLMISCDSEKKISLTGKYTLEPFSSLEEMRNAARLSKGHLTYEMERLITSKNAQEIFNFVNSRFSTIPSSGRSITNASYNIRWGMRGLLRCGKGTIREKSDLLFYMLTEAGFSPKYFRKNIELNNKLLNEAFCVNKEDNDVLIDVPNSYTKKWDNALNDSEIKEIIVDIENAEEKSKALANQIKEHLPEDAHTKLKHFDWLGVDGIEFPVIRIKDKESVYNLNLFEAKKYNDFKDTNPKNLYPLDYKKTNKNIGKVRVILRATYSDSINMPTELVRGEWDLETLIGRQVALQFVPPISTKQQLLSNITQLNQFVPFLTLRDPEMKSEERKKHSFKGVGFDMFGNKFQEDGDGIIRVNGFKMNKPEKQDTSSVKSIKAALIDHQYPTITVKIAPLDANGKPVLGLGGGAFSIKDCGKLQQAVITKNYVAREVLLFFDSTASMPYPYGAYTLPEDVKNKIVSQLENQFYGQVKIDTANYGANEFSKNLEHFATKKYDSILCFSDGGEFDEKVIDILKSIAKDIPVAYFYVNSALSIPFEKVKEFFANTSLPYHKIEDLETGLKSVIKAMDSNISYPYTLTYVSPWLDDVTIHDVEVGITDNTTVKPEKLRYVYNREGEYEDAPFPCGLSLEIQWKENYTTKSIYRHLAGFDNRIDKDKNLASVEFSDAIKSFCLGTHLLCFEADKPTFPALLDDVLTASLTQAPLALSENDTLDELIKKLENTQPLPEESIATFCGIENPVSRDRITFENRFQSCLYSEFYDIGKRESVFKMDMLPISDIRTFAPSKKEAFYATLEKTALLALSEANLFKTSTFSDLQNKSLHRFNGNESKHELYPIFQYVKDYYYHILYDASLSSNSYWQINRDTGALLGMLPDGSGGGSIIQKQRLDMALKIWEAWTNLLVKVTKGGMAMGIVALYGMFLAELYGLVASTVNEMGANTDFEKDLKDLLKKYVKKTQKRIKKGIKTKK